MILNRFYVCNYSCYHHFIISGMKTELISTYLKYEHVWAPLFPLVQTKDIKIDQLYVQPNMQLENKNLDSYKDLFQTHRNIYVVADAGLGKTALCQKMVSTWCRVQSDTIENMSNDQQAMAKFDYVFYISLREADNHNDVEEMIKHQLLDEKYPWHIEGRILVIRIQD